MHILNDMINAYTGLVKIGGGGGEAKKKKEKEKEK